MLPAAVISVVETVSVFRDLANRIIRVSDYSLRRAPLTYPCAHPRSTSHDIEDSLAIAL